MWNYSEIRDQKVSQTSEVFFNYSREQRSLITWYGSMCHTSCANVGIKAPLLPHLTCACQKKMEPAGSKCQGFKQSHISLWDSDITSLIVMITSTQTEHCAGKRTYCYPTLTYFKYRISTLSSHFFLSPIWYLQFLSP